MDPAKVEPTNIDCRRLSHSGRRCASIRRYRAALRWAVGSPYPPWRWYSCCPSSRLIRGALHVRRPGRGSSLALVGVIGVANLISLVLLVRALVQGAANDSHKLLLAALQVWITNIIVFGLAYWELDRGGPVQRAALLGPSFHRQTSDSPRMKTPTRLTK